MAGETQYINPIIQAMLHTAQLSATQRALQQRGEQFKEENKLREQALTIHEKEIERQHEQFQEMLEKVHLPQVQAAVAHNKILTIDALRQIAQGGGDISKMFPEGTPQSTTTLPPAGQKQIPQAGLESTVNVPGVGENIPPSAFGNPAQAAEIQRILAQAKAGGARTGQLEAEDPYVTKYKGIDAQNRFNLQQAELAGQLKNRQAEIGQTQAGNERLERIRQGGENSRAKLAGEYRIKGIEIANGLDPDDPLGSSNVAENLMDGILQGQEDYKALPKMRKQQIDQLATSRGWVVPTDQKKYAKDLDSVSTVQQVINQFRDLATNYSIDAPKGGFGQIYEKGQIPGVIPVSELNSKLDTMKGSGGTLASYFDQQNRKSDAEIIREVQSAFDPKATRQANLTKLDDLTKRLDNTVKNSFRGMPPDQVNHILSAHGVTDFGGYGVPQKSNQSPSKVIWTTDANGLPTPQPQGAQQ